MDAGELGARHLSVTWLVLPAGTKQDLRSHEEAEQAYVVVRGSGTMSVAGDTQSVSEGDLILVPPATEHSINNDGDEEFACPLDPVAAGRGGRALQRSARRGGGLRRRGRLLGALPFRNFCFLRATRALCPVSVAGMPELSRMQVVVWGAIAVALLFIGARAVRGESGGGSSYAGDYSTGSYDDEAGESEAGEEESFSVSGEAGDVVVDVTGAVRRPGVYRLPAGSRVNDAVKRAGGASGKAELESLNLAASLADGQQVVVPERAPAGAPAGNGVAATAGAAEEGPISLATATAAELDTIDGIGPVTAEDIINFREEHGGLSSVDQLDQISGIGPATMEALRERLGP